MFKPQFHISEAFQNRLRSIDETNTYLRRLTFTREKMKGLKDEALTTSIYLIVQPEDRRVGYGRVARVLESPVLKPADTSEHLIINICSVLNKIRTYSNSGEKLGEDDFLELHRLMKSECQGSDKIEQMGKPYRDSHTDIRENSQRNQRNQRKLYDAAPHSDIQMLITELFEWLAYESRDIHPMIRAIVAYFQIIIVRPFCDDNCKLAWFLFLSTLALNEFDFGNYISLEKDIFVSRDVFHNDVLHLVSGTFDSGDFSSSDFQPYIMYLLPSLENTISERRLYMDKEHFNEVGEILRKANLNKRQKKALVYVAEKGRITNREYQKLNEMHNRKLAWQELGNMIKSEILRDVDREQKRNAGYELGSIIEPETLMKHL